MHHSLALPIVSQRLFNMLKMCKAFQFTTFGTQRLTSCSPDITFNDSNSFISHFSVTNIMLTTDSVGPEIDVISNGVLLFCLFPFLIGLV